jgi:hypothetical protein
MTKLFHNSFYLIFSININAVLFISLINSDCENDESWRLIFASLVKETYLEWWCFFEELGCETILINTSEWVVVVDSGFHIAFTHFYLYCEKQRSTFWVETEMIAAIKFSKLRNLVVNTVNASHHVGAGGCSRQEI